MSIEQYKMGNAIIEEWRYVETEVLILPIPFNNCSISSFREDKNKEGLPCPEMHFCDSDLYVSFFFFPYWSEFDI